MVCYLACVYLRQPRKHTTFTESRGYVEWRTALKNALASNNTNDISTEFPATQVDLNEEAGSATHLVSDTTVVRRGYPLTTEADVAKYAHPNHIESVVQYLARPVRVASGNWVTSATQGSALFTTDSIWKSLAANTMFSEKLKGFFGVRGTVLLRLQLNGTPFQAGRVRLSYYPCAALAPLKVAEHLRHVISISQLPGIDATPLDHSVGLEIPWMNPMRFLPMTSQTASMQAGWGGVYLHVISPLKTGPASPATCSWTLWASIEGAEVFGQSNLPIVVPQSGIRGRIKARGKMRIEAENPVISSILDSGAKLAGTLEHVPVLTGLAGSARWALNAASQAALAFGFSKPQVSGLSVTANRPAHYMTNADGIDTSVMLSLQSDAKLTIDPTLYPSGMDEMSLAFIKKQWSYLYNVNWTTSQLAGASLDSWDLNPLAMRADSGAFSYCTPIGYLARLFQYYRGGFEVMFKFNKTAFHSGTIAISYIPGRSDTNLALDSSAYAYRTVVDIQEGQEVCLAIPYMFPMDYIHRGLSYGRLHVTIVNPLLAPESVSPDINISVYVRGMDDLEFQGFQPEAKLVVVAQGGDVTVSQEAVCAVVGGAPATGNAGASFAEASASEMPTSLRQLHKIYQPLRLNATPAQSLRYYPWSTQPTKLSADGVTVTKGAIFTPVRDMLTAPFAFMRGGRRVLATQPPGVSWKAMSNFFTPATQASVSSDTPANYGSRVTPFGATVGYETWVTAPDGPLSVTIPWTAQSRFGPIEYTKDVNVDTTWLCRRVLTLACSAPTTGEMGELYEAGADDFETFYFVGIPRMSSANLY